MVAATASSAVLSPEFLTDTHRVVAKLRESDPVHWVPELEFWLVTRYDDVRRLFTDPNCTPDSSVWERYEPPPAGSWKALMASKGLMSAPPEEHARQRRLVSAALTPRAVQRMEWQVREVVEQFTEPLRGRTGVVDLIDEFTNPIPNAVISRITGIPAKGDDDRRFRELAQLTIRGFFSYAPEEVKRASEAASEEMRDWVASMAEERRRTPREDLVSDLVQAQAAGERMSNDEIVMMISALVSAGSETTMLGGTFALRSLLRHPDQLAKLRANKQLLDNTVMEVLRFDFGQGGGLPRYALRDFELRGKQIRKGQQLQLSFQGAHGDPSVFPDPERFDIERDTSEVVIFGRGPHFCLGANLAKQELRCMIEGALDFLPPGARLREDLVRWNDMVILRRMENLPVEFGG
jgi:cytochrome P450